MSALGWRLYAVVVIVGVGAYLVVPEGPWWRAAWQGLGAYGTAAALVIGARQIAPRQRGPWWILATGCVVTGAATTLDNFGITVFGTTPDLTDMLFLAFYPAVAVAVVMMILRLQHRMDWAALVDALTVTVGVGLLTWIYAIDPVLHSGEPAATQALTVAYPIGDLVLLTLTILLLRSNGRRGGNAPRWIAGCITLYLVGDWAWVVVGLHRAWNTPGATRGIDAVYLSSLAVLGFAGYRPQIRDDGPGAAAVSRLSRSQLALLTAGVLIAPSLLAAEQSAHAVSHGYVIAGGSATMFLLVVARMAQLLRQSERHSQQVRQLSRTDELTGMPNRRAWIDELPRALEQARRHGTTISIGMIDLDHFKRYNDLYGHPAGDRFLQQAAAAWTAALRHYDTLARYGGEEFILLLPGTNDDQATAVMQRIRSATPCDETFSAGVATWDGAETSDDLIGRADAALYRAKASGRDRICVATAAVANGGA